MAARPAQPWAQRPLINVDRKLQNRGCDLKAHRLFPPPPVNAQLSDGCLRSDCCLKFGQCFFDSLEDDQYCVMAMFIVADGLQQTEIMPFS